MRVAHSCSCQICLVEQDHHFLKLCRYIESNALRANLAERAQTWDLVLAAPADPRTRPDETVSGPLARDSAKQLACQGE